MFTHIPEQVVFNERSLHLWRGKCVDSIVGRQNRETENEASLSSECGTVRVSDDCDECGDGGCVPHYHEKVF